MSFLVSFALFVMNDRLRQLLTSKDMKGTEEGRRGFRCAVIARSASFWGDAAISLFFLPHHSGKRRDCPPRRVNFARARNDGLTARRQRALNTYAPRAFHTSVCVNPHPNDWQGLGVSTRQRQNRRMQRNRPRCGGILPTLRVRAWTSSFGSPIHSSSGVSSLPQAPL